MTELVFKGKEFVWNHHLAVPFRPLVPDAAKGIGAPRLDGNLIIRGDNLHALKALLPQYAGKVDVIFIDPPYNTGNEGWAYNDNVNAPMIKEWLDSNPIGIEDGLRHDKWCAMMWPRLRLLHELLAENGSLWVTLDDNECDRARLLLDEIFGDDAFVAKCIWHKNFSPKNSALYFSEDHDYLLVYAKNKQKWRPNLLSRTEEMEARYSNPDNDPRGPWTSGDLTARNFYSEGLYPVIAPNGREISGPPQGRYWAVSKSNFETLARDNRIWWGKDGGNMPRLKRFLSDVKAGKIPQTIWHYSEVGHTQDAKKEILKLFKFDENSDVFITPKPVDLIGRILEIAASGDSLILDSFAGSGTTAHAVLEANRRDGGNRRFILVEMEDYADRLTAERVRRVITGYDFTGTQKTELLREKLNWRALEKAEDIRHRVEAIENLHGHEYDRIKKDISGGELVVTGEKAVSERAEGLGGEFTYCTLGEPVELDRILKGDGLPAFEALGAVLFHMATSQVAAEDAFRPDDFYLGQHGDAMYWLIYKPDLSWLQSAEAALSLGFARTLHSLHPGKRHTVFAPARHASRRVLDEKKLNVEFAPLPFALYRVERV